jgi:predicted aspartyl protease
MFIQKVKLTIALWKGGKRVMTALIDTYVGLIVVHRRTIDQVPENLRTAVQADLTALGLDGNGNPLPTTPTEPVAE